MSTIADRLNTDSGLKPLELEAEDPQVLPGAPNSPVLATPAAAFVVGAKVAGAGLGAFGVGVAVGEAID